MLITVPSSAGDAGDRAGDDGTDASNAPSPAGDPGDRAGDAADEAVGVNATVTDNASAAPTAAGPLADAAAAVSAGIGLTVELQARDAFLAALDQAVRFSLGGDRAIAAAAYLEIIAGGYNRVEPLYNLGVLAEHDEKGSRYQGDDLNYAAAFYVAALAEDPRYHPARLNLAVIYHKTGLTEDATIEYRKLLGTGSPEEGPARYNLAVILLEQGRYEEGIETLEGAKEPYSDVRRLMLAALLNEEVGAPARAIKLWKRALAEDPAGPYAVVAERHLRDLRGY